MFHENKIVRIHKNLGLLRLKLIKKPQVTEVFIALILFSFIIIYKKNI